jgi:protein-tyrosine phosphatase
MRACAIAAAHIGQGSSVATGGILSALDFPVVMTSVNKSGEPPAADAAEIEARGLAHGVALLVDGGPSRLRESSSVLRVGNGRFELLREGLHDAEQLRAAAGLRIGFVCTGNTCRSPMAEGIARHLLAERLGVRPGRLRQHGFELSSMGVVARSGAEASPLAVEVLQQRGIDISRHGSSPALAEVVAALDRVYCMTATHLEALRMLLPPGRDARITLLDPEGGDIPDPIGGDAEVYRDAADRIEECIQRRLDEWA